MRRNILIGIGVLLALGFLSSLTRTPDDTASATGSPAPRATATATGSTLPELTAEPTLPPTPAASPTVAYMLARVNARDATTPDLRTSEADAGRAFQAFLDCVRRAYPDQTEASAGDTLVSAWQNSAKRETLLAFAQALC